MEALGDHQHPARDAPTNRRVGTSSEAGELGLAFMSPFRCAVRGLARKKLTGLEVWNNLMTDEAV